MKRVMQAVPAFALAAALAIGGAGRGTSGEAPAAGTPAPVNPYAGMQEREEVFEFAQKPQVKKEGDKWVITFASKAACDATVAIVGKDGKIVRHLASGVLGKNAPHPFQQNSLLQKLEWDGLKDSFEKADAAGCTVKVSLGLKPVLDSNVAWNPYDNRIPYGGCEFVVGKMPDGGRCVLRTEPTCGHVFDKDGKYVSTFWPPKAADLEKAAAKCGFKLATTKWGDKTVFSVKGGSPFACFRGKGVDGVKAVMTEMGATDLQTVKEYPADLKDPEAEAHKDIASHWIRDPKVLTVKAYCMAVTPDKDEYWIGAARFDGSTGVHKPCDNVPTAIYRYGAGSGDNVCFGPDGLLYGRFGMYCRQIWRVDAATGKMGPPFKYNVMTDPKPSVPGFEYQHERLKGKPGKTSDGDLKQIPTGALIMGSVCDGCGAAEHGFDVNERGLMVAMVSSGGLIQRTDPEKYDDKWLAVSMTPYTPAIWAAEGLGLDVVGFALGVWDGEGRCLSTNAIEGMAHGSGAWMDRDGNVYVVQAQVHPRGTDKQDGVTDLSGGWRGISSVIKFRGLGGKFPVGKYHVDAAKKKGGFGVAEPAPADALQLSATLNGYKGDVSASGALWSFPMGGHSGGDCQCDYWRPQMDGYARTWIPAGQIGSVTVIDANGNRVARVGRYGNVNDADPAYGNIHFAYVRTVAANDSWMWAVDQANQRVVKAALKYAAEESVPLP